MRRRDSILWYLFAALCILFCFVYPIALVGVVFDVHPPFALNWAGSALLYLEGTILILAAMLVYGWRRALSAALVVILLAYGVETLGVNTGIPFGEYIYTHVLVPRLPGGVPLPVMFAWVLVIFGVYGWCRELVERAPNGRINIAVGLFGALLATLLDLEIEPVAASLQGYWRWLEPGPLSYNSVPLSNFAAWYLVALVLLLLVQVLLGHTKAMHAQRSRLALVAPRVLFVASLLMFGLVDLTHTYFGAAAPGLLAGLLLLFLSSRPE